ncbi:MAG: hypothetical protein IH991_11210 [Planctomycetes bacterium]|nr:hypothetical protein [Planctomycetota bacterium]
MSGWICLILVGGASIAIIALKQAALMAIACGTTQGQQVKRLRRTKPASVVTAAIANRWLRWLYHQMQEPKDYEQAA